MDLFTLAARLTLDKTEYEQGLSEAESSAQSKGSKIGNAMKVVGTAGLGVAAGVAAAGTAIYKMSTNSAAASDRVDKMSQKLGLSRTAFQELDFITSQSGTSVESLKGGIRTLTNAMEAANSGSEEAAAMFDKLGISIYDSNGNMKSQEQILFDTISALQNMEDGTEKAALANDLLGKSGSELMPLLNGSAGSMEAMRQQAHDLGLVLYDDTIDAGVKLTDTLDQAKRAFGAITTRIGAEVMPIVQKALDLVIENMPYIQLAIQTVMTVFSTFVTNVVDNVNKYIMPTIGSITAFIKDVFQGDWAAAWEEVKNIFHNAWTGLTDFIKDIFGAVKDWIMSVDWAEVGQTMMTLITDAFSTIGEWALEVFTALGEWIKSVDWVGVGTAVWNFITDAFANIGAWALEKFGELGEWIKSVDWVAVGTAIWDTIISAFSNIAEWALEKFGYLGDVIKSIDWLAVGNAIWDFIITAFNNIGGWALEAFGILASTIKSINWLEVGQTIWNFIKAGVGYVAKGVGKVVQWAKDFGGEIRDKIKETNWEELGQNIWEKIRTGVGYISKGVGTVLQWAKDLGSDIYDKLDNTQWGPLGTSIWTKIKTGIGFLSKGTGAVVDWAKDLASEIHDRINEKDWKGLGETITKALKEGVGYISKGVGTIIQWAIDLGGDIRDGIKSIGWTQLGTDVWTNIKSGFSSVFAWGHAKLMEAWRGITSIDWAGLGSDMWGKIKGAFSDVWSFFSGVFDLRNIPFHLPYIHVEWQDIGFLSIPHFSVRWNARGYNNPLLFQALGLLGNMGFGDLGNYQGGELVYSHDKLMDDIREASGGSGGNIITINVYQQEGEDGEALAERIGQIMNDDYSRKDMVIYA